MDLGIITSIAACPAIIGMTEISGNKDVDGIQRSMEILLGIYLKPEMLGELWGTLLIKGL
jgi:hypothetical protein